jgi:hypothetical protein
MQDEWEKFHEPLSEGGILPEDEEAFLRTIEITKEILSSPRNARPDLVHQAIEEWQNLAAHLTDHQEIDLVSEVVELLDEVFRRQHITFDEAMRGKAKMRTLARFLGLSKRREPEAWG